MDLKKEFQIADNLISQEKRVKAQIKIAQKFAEHYHALQLQQTGVMRSYSSVQCGFCGSVQCSNNKKCIKCGAKFL